MAVMSGGEALARSLVGEGVEVVFGIPGIQIYGIVVGMRDETGLRLITTRHEQATTYMADGYARASGKPGVALVVPGVGIFNAASGLVNAYSRSTPVLLIAGQIPRGAMGKGRGAVHEVEDQASAIRLRNQVATAGVQAKRGAGGCLRGIQADAHGTAPSRTYRDAPRCRRRAGRGATAESGPDIPHRPQPRRSS